MGPGKPFGETVHCALLKINALTRLSAKQTSAKLRFGIDCDDVIGKGFTVAGE